MNENSLKTTQYTDDNDLIASGTEALLRAIRAYDMTDSLTSVCN